MSLPEELREALRIKEPDDTVAYFTTASLDGTPNVSVQQFTDVEGDYVLLPDLFAQKTKVNLNENQRAALTIASPASLAGWVIEGPANVIQWGHPASYRFHELPQATSSSAGATGPIASGSTRCPRRSGRPCSHSAASS